MPLVVLHRETFSGLNYAKLRERVAELEAQYPGSKVTTRRVANYGYGFNVTVKGEGEAKSIQTRGHCQFCGNHQVVKDDVLVLHGYQRPGNGWIFGRCPGAGERPLQKDETITRASLQATQERLAALQKAEPRLVRQQERAQAEYDRSEPGMLYAMPSKGYKYNATPAEKAEIEKAHEAALARFFKTHPKTEALVKANAELRAHNVALSQAKGGVEHFNLLLSWKLLGTPLLEVAKG